MRITVFFISGLSLVVSAAEYRSSGTTLVRDAVLPYIEKGELPGAISVLEKNGVCEIACLGYSNVAEKRRITMNDAFMQCSQTKGFCGVTIA